MLNESFLQQLEACKAHLVDGQAGPRVDKPSEAMGGQVWTCRKGQDWSEQREKQGRGLTWRGDWEGRRQRGGKRGRKRSGILTDLQCVESRKELVPSHATTCGAKIHIWPNQIGLC